MTVLSVALSSTLVLPSTAHALPPNSGNWTRYLGPAASSTQLSYGYASWNANASPKSVYLSAEGYALGSGNYETTYFDWRIGEGDGSDHYDGRAVRDCRSVGYNASKTFTDSLSRINGVAKLGVCFGPNNQRGQCENYDWESDTYGMPWDWTSGQGVTCISWARRDATGTALVTNNGGEPRQCGY